MRCPHFMGFCKYTNEPFGTEKSVRFYNNNGGALNSDIIRVYIRVVTHITVSFYASQTLSGAEKSLACETNGKRTWLYSGAWCLRPSWFRRYTFHIML